MTIYLYLVSRLKMRGVVLPPSHVPFSLHVAVKGAHGKLILFFPSSVISHLRNFCYAHRYFLPLSSSTARIHLLLCPSISSLYLLCIYLIFSLSSIPLYFFRLAFLYFRYFLLSLSSTFTFNCYYIH